MGQKLLTSRDVEQEQKLLSRRDVEQKIGYSCSSIYRFMKAHHFPKPIKIGEACRWVEHEVDQWINERIATRDADCDG
jgi:prophage regulatory protein